MADQNVHTNFTANVGPLQAALSAAKSAVDEFASKSPQGIRKLDNAFKDLSLQSLGVSGNIARLGDALLEFIPGGIITAGVVAGVGGVILATKKQQEAHENAVKAADNLRLSLMDLTIAQRSLNQTTEQSTLDVLNNDLEKARIEAGKAEEELVKLNKERQKVINPLDIFRVVPATGGATGPIAAIDRFLSRTLEGFGIGVTSEDILNQTDVLAKAQADVLRAEKALKDFRQNSSRDRLEQLQKEKRAIEEAAIAFKKFIAASQESALKGFEERMKAEADRIAAMRKNISDELTKTIDTDKLSQDIEESFRGVQLVSPEIDKIMLKQQQSYNTMSLVAQAASEGWQMMFEVIGQGGNALGNLGKGFARLTAGLAKTKAAENIAYAVENLAKAFGFIALGNTASTAAAGKAAAGHFKAAALWGALGGGATALAGGTSGPGGIGGGGAFSQSMVGQNTFTTQQPLTIIVQGGLLDMSNPETQRSFTSALETVTNRRVRMVGA